MPYPSKIEEKISACFSHSPIASILSTKKRRRKRRFFHFFQLLLLFQAFRNFFNDNVTQFILCHFRILFHGTVFIKKGSNVGGYIETGARHSHIIGHQHIQIFPFQLFFAVLYDIIRFCSKAYKELAFLFLPQTIKNIRVLGQLNVQNIMGLFF